MAGERDFCLIVVLRINLSLILLVVPFQKGNLIVLLLIMALRIGKKLGYSFITVCVF